jgi:hypothetical protein
MHYQPIEKNGITSNYLPLQQLYLMIITDSESQVSDHSKFMLIWQAQTINDQYPKLILYQSSQ